MHKNLITTFSFNKTHTRLDSLKGFQQIISDTAYGTFFSVYAKMNAEDHPGDSDYYSLKDAVFYIQNFSGQVTIGIESVDHQIDMAYYKGINEPVYFITINVMPLAYRPFYPDCNNELFDHVENEELAQEQKLEGLDFKMAAPLSIKKYIEQTDDMLAYKDGYLNKKYKIMFHIQYVPNFQMLDIKEDKNGDLFKKSRFLDEKYFERYGEMIQPTSDLVKTNINSNIDKDTGCIAEYIGIKCRNGIIGHNLLTEY